VPEHHHERRAEHGDRVLDAAEHLRPGGVPGRTHHEEVTETAVEDDLGGEP